MDILLHNLIVGSETAPTAKSERKISIYSYKKHDILKSAKFFKSEVFESAKIKLLISIYKTIVYALLNWTVHTTAEKFQSWNGLCHSGYAFTCNVEHTVIQFCSYIWTCNFGHRSFQTTGRAIFGQNQRRWVQGFFCLFALLFFVTLPSSDLHTSLLRLPS